MKFVHIPPYSPDLVPEDFHMFGLLKEGLHEHTFDDTEALNKICADGLEIAVIFSAEYIYLHKDGHTLLKMLETTLRSNYFKV